MFGERNDCFIVVDILDTPPPKNKQKTTKDFTVRKGKDTILGLNENFNVAIFCQNYGNVELLLSVCISEMIHCNYFH